MISLKIHLTEPSVILSGSASNEESDYSVTDSSNSEIGEDPPAVNDGAGNQPLKRTQDSMSNTFSSNETLPLGAHAGSSFEQPSTSSSTTLNTANSSGQRGLVRRASTESELTAKKSMARGFVVLQVPEEIHVRQLSIKLLGNSQASRLTSSASMSSSNLTVLVDDEYTILDAGQGGSNCASPRLPSYNLHESTKSSSAVADISAPASRSSISAGQISQRMETEKDEDFMIDQNFAERKSPTGPWNSQKEEPKLGGAEEKVLRSRNPSTQELPKASSELESPPNSYQSGLGSVFHSGLDSPTKEREESSHSEPKNLLAKSRLPLRPPPMYQDPVFSDMLAERYHLLSSFRDKSKAFVKSPINETQFVVANLHVSDLNDPGRGSEEDSDLHDLLHSPRIPSSPRVGSVNRRGSLTLIKTGVSNIFDNLKPRRGSLFGKSSKVTRIDQPSVNDLYGEDGLEASLGLTEPIQRRSNQSSRLKDSTKNLRQSNHYEEGGSNGSSRNKDSGCSSKLESNSKGSGWRNPIGESNKMFTLIRDGSFKLRQSCRRMSSISVTGPNPEETLKDDKGPDYGNDPTTDLQAGRPSRPINALKLSPGVYKYPIVIPVPGDLPPSVKCQKGSVSYNLDATLTYQTISNPTLMTLKHRTSVELVDPCAGVRSLNPTNRQHSSEDEDLVNAVYSGYSGMNIERMWDDQLFYQIRLNSRKFLIGGKINFEIQFTPLSQMKIYSFQADIEEKTQYYIDHEKNFMKHSDSQTYGLIRLEHTSPLTIASKNSSTHAHNTPVKLRASDVPILPIISSEPSFVRKSPLIQYVKTSRANSNNSDNQNGSTGVDSGRENSEAEGINALTRYSKDGGPWSLNFNLRLPTCSSAESRSTIKKELENPTSKPSAGINFSCNHKKSPIVIKHYLKLRMRVERGDDKALDKRGRRKRYDIILSSPIQIISCRCKPYSLPAYSSSDKTNVTDVLSILKEINNNEDPSFRCNCIEKLE